MLSRKIDLSPRGRARVILVTFLGTLLCIATAFTIDSFSFKTGGFELDGDPWNNLIIPLVLAPPLFYFLLSKLRELAIAHQALAVIASTDALTSCLNRRAFTTLVDAWLQQIDQNDQDAPGALLVIDVDHFKAVNDQFGHEGGDEALKAIAIALKSELREGDLVGRMGGEEFGIFLPAIQPDAAVAVAERIRAAVNRIPFVHEGQRRELAVSIGGATYRGPVSFHVLFRSADRWLYFAKRNGRNRVDVQPLGNDAFLRLAAAS